MNITSAQFVKSSSSVEECPTDNLPEYAFIGRSNVGKSSLINMLTGKPKLALTGSTPGKTRLINHFLINESWHIVDLPGYGFARRGLKEREAFAKMIDDYVTKRSQLVSLFILIDSRIAPQAIDLKFIRDMGEKGIPFVLIMTKIDKISKGKLQSAIAHYKDVLSEEWEELPPFLVSSAETKQGRDEILHYISQTIHL
ncbi:ribosome biogenesis GTP-binding protein YihA/YsxC [Porphyromonas miyakawae]|jgi:hypothetical protein|uniref:Probable GTP-binding protein EngB n=1 Tax=Porphyromonas miyakawae TaxID=3137470 RepID=A0ABQ0E232_9PORP